jgi:hypothetical protein
VADSPFSFSDIRDRRAAARLMPSLPPFTGPAIRIERAPGLTDRRGPVHAGSFLRERRIALNCTRAEFRRIFVHEVFHFVWLRAGNTLRRSWETLLAEEQLSGSCGELGWSSEWRKAALTPGDIAGRTRRWREYCCESLCDTAAWFYSGGSHAEFTLTLPARRRRGEWFQKHLGNAPISI